MTSAETQTQTYVSLVNLEERLRLLSLGLPTTDDAEVSR